MKFRKIKKTSFLFRKIQKRSKFIPQYTYSAKYKLEFFRFRKIQCLKLKKFRKIQDIGQNIPQNTGEKIPQNTRQETKHSAKYSVKSSADIPQNTTFRKLQ